MFKSCLAAAIAVGAMAASSATWAQVKVGPKSASNSTGRFVRAQDPGSLVAALLAAGYKAQLARDMTGDPKISSEVSGTEYTIFFYNCIDHKGCATVQFQMPYQAARPITLAEINQWNRTQRFGHAYLDRHSDPVIVMDLDLDDGGLSPALFIDNIEFWTAVAIKFKEQFGKR